MSKKKRFRKKTVGRLTMFFKKNPYVGHSNFSAIKYQSKISENTDNFINNLRHYQKCYKKKNFPHPPHVLPA